MYLLTVEYRNERWRLVAVHSEEYSWLRRVLKPHLKYRGLWGIQKYKEHRNGSWFSFKRDQ
jgi:hypothetical protein